MTYYFTHQLPPGKKTKLAFLNLVVVLALCIVGYFVSEVFWDEYTYEAWSLRYRTTVTAGWPASLQGWSLWLGIAIVICLPIMYYMQDWRNPSLGLTSEGLFINQQLIRNQHVPFSNIASVQKKDHEYEIKFKDNAAIYTKTRPFRYFVKYNLENGNFFISQIHTSGEIDALMEALQKKIK